MKIDYTVSFSSIQKQQILDKYGLDGGRTQKVIDEAFKSFMVHYMPMDTGVMIANTIIPSTGGEIDVNVPYAHYQHEGELYVDPITHKGAFYNKNEGRFWSRPNVEKIPSGKRLNYHGGSLRGDHFAERMLADHFEDILNAGQKEIDK